MLNHRVHTEHRNLIGTYAHKVERFLRRQVCLIQCLVSHCAVDPATN